MAISINFPDKILAGVHQSYTILSDEGAPQVRVQLGGASLPHRLIPLGAPKDSKVSTTSDMKYKVTFLLPQDSAGKTVALELVGPASRAEESRPITAD